jgi:hypothetical protein
MYCRSKPQMQSGRVGPKFSDWITINFDRSPMDNLSLMVVAGVLSLHDSRRRLGDHDESGTVHDTSRLSALGDPGTTGKEAVIYFEFSRSRCRRCIDQGSDKTCELDPSCTLHGAVDERHSKSHEQIDGVYQLLPSRQQRSLFPHSWATVLRCRLPRAGASLAVAC